MNKPIKAIDIATFTPTIGMNIPISPSSVLTDFNTKSEYKTTEINQPKVSLLILSSSNLFTKCDVYLEVESCKVTKVIENATPNMVVQPPAIADKMLRAESALPVKIIEFKKGVSILNSLLKLSSILEVNKKPKNAITENTIG